MQPDGSATRTLPRTAFVFQELGVASNFHLLAFMNRKVKQEFIKPVLRGKFNAAWILGNMRKVFAAHKLQVGGLEGFVPRISRRKKAMLMLKGVAVLSFSKIENHL